MAAQRPARRRSSRRAGVSRNDADGALASLREAQTLASGLADAGAGDASARLSLAEIDEALAQALAAKNDLGGALAAANDARQACQRLVAAAPGDARFVAALGAAFLAQGDINAKASRVDAARDAYGQAVAVFAKRADDAPKDVSALDGLAVAQDHLRAALRDAGDAKGALAAAAAAARARKAIGALVPNSPAALHNAIDAANQAGFALEAAGRP